MAPPVSYEEAQDLAAECRDITQGVVGPDQRFGNGYPHLTVISAAGAAFVKAFGVDDRERMQSLVPLDMASEVAWRLGIRYS